MKKPFDVPLMLTKVEKAIASFPKAAMFELYSKGYTSLFEQLVSCIISIRTRDETTIPLAVGLFQKARTPVELMKVKPEDLEKLLIGSQYPGQKAYTLLGIAKIAIEEYGGHLPANYDKLTALKGVGPKCAKLALGVAASVPGISVDVHVHRVVNRWRLISSKTPEKTMLLLESILPEENWITVNKLLMPFGKHICVAHLPFCSSCPVVEYCHQVGVKSHR